MVNTYQKMVEEFHQKLGATIGTTPELRESELRAKLILEEAVETVAAMGFAAHAGFSAPYDKDEYQPDEIAKFFKMYDKPNFLDTIDGYCDLIYVVLGAAVTDGIDLDPFFTEVHRANIAKLGGGMREDGKFLKPDGWQPPDHERILIHQQNLANLWADLEAEFWAEGEVVNTAEARHERLTNGEAA